ncbi:MAG: AraC family transcriptional regulator [Oscillospiraceae bacterium]|nr:AraC family transcriptional regulator [Oscillospiraceae bacterium]
MHYLFEESNILNNPMECFVFDAAKEVFPVKPHWHYFTEIIFMLEGCARMRLDESTFIAEKGSLVIFHPKSVHAIYAADGEPLLYAVMKFDIGGFTMTSAYAPPFKNIFRRAQLDGAQVYFSPEIAEEMGCPVLFENCIKELDTYSYGFDLMIKADIYRLLMSIVRCWRESGLSIEACVFDEDGADIDGATEYIDSLMSENIKVAEIAEHFNMSYSCFAKKFRGLYGMTCKEYIERMRIYKAEELLLFTDHDLNFISQETGFSDCSHLIKSFRKLRGMTPKQFRKSKKK